MVSHIFVISYVMSYMIWRLILVMCRRLLSYWRLSPTIRILFLNSMWYVTLIWMGMAWCGMHGHNSFSTAPFVPAAARVQNTQQTTRKCPWCISVRLSPSIWPQIASCNRQVCPCYTTLPATRDCPACTSALLQMYWGEPPSSPASLTAAVIRIFPTNSRTADSWGRHPPIPSRIAGMAAEFTRWISGCGATDGASPGRCPLMRRKLSGRINWVRQGKGLRRQRNAVGRQQHVQRRRNENVCSNFIYDIICDITILDVIYDIIYDITIFNYDIITMISYMTSQYLYDIIYDLNHASIFMAWGFCTVSPTCLAFMKMLYILPIICKKCHEVGLWFSGKIDCPAVCRPGFESWKHHSVFCSFLRVHRH